MLVLGSDCTICYDTGEDLLQSLHKVDQFGLYDIVFDSVSSDDPRDAASSYEQRLRVTRGGGGSGAAGGGGRVGVLDEQAGMYIMLGGHVSTADRQTDRQTDIHTSYCALLTAHGSLTRLADSIPSSLCQVSDWIKAHILRFLGWNLFGCHRLLFWVRFPVCFEHLTRLRGYCEQGQLSTTLAGTYAFTTEGVQQGRWGLYCLLSPAVCCCLLLPD